MMSCPAHPRRVLLYECKIMYQTLFLTHKRLKSLPWCASFHGIPNVPCYRSRPQSWYGNACWQWHLQHHEPLSMAMQKRK